MRRILSDHETSILRAFPDSEFGRVFLDLLQREIIEEVEAYEDNSKICDNPLKDDFRCKMGIIIGLKRALNLPSKYINNQQS